MDYRCPCCGVDLGNRRRIYTIIARMEIDCTHCGRRIHLNMHPLEEKIVFVGFGLFLALVVPAHFLKSQLLGMLALTAGMLALVALPLLERIWLKGWARYVPADAGSGRDSS